jgi:hypothetical protein
MGDVTPNCISDSGKSHSKPLSCLLVPEIKGQDNKNMSDAK